MTDAELVSVNRILAMLLEALAEEHMRLSGHHIAWNPKYDCATCARMKPVLDAIEDRLSVEKEERS